MTTLISLAQLEVATQNAPGSLTGDTFAEWVVEEASGLVCDTAGHAEWEDDITQAPRAARRICLTLAKRSYENPGAVLQEGALGPIGGDRVADTQAMFLMLTDAEIEELEDMAGGTSSSGLWIQPINDATAPDTTAYLLDDSGSDWPIPYADFDDTDVFTTPEDTLT